MATVTLQGPRRRTRCFFESFVAWTKSFAAWGRKLSYWVRFYPATVGTTLDPAGADVGRRSGTYVAGLTEKGALMRVEQMQWTPESAWVSSMGQALGETADLVMLFGNKQHLRDPALISHVTGMYPQALMIGCSTAGEIRDIRVTDDTLVVTAVDFEHTVLRGELVEIAAPEDSFEAGERLAGLLPHEELSHVFVLSDGLNVNGSELVKGITLGLPEHVSVTGGLSGDGGRFEETLVLWRGEARHNAALAVGFYGDRIKIGCGSLGGWDSFGPERLITRSQGNVLYEMDGKSALELYKQYLGEHAEGLPATGLLFPLSLRARDGSAGVVRTILAVDEKEQSLTFAGDVPQGYYARLMKANFDRLIDGAVSAARSSSEPLQSSTAELAILISCVGRKMVLKQRIEEEVEGVRDVLGDKPVLTGFYSYGEISPFTPDAKCELHNQTMTITTFSET